MMICHVTNAFGSVTEYKAPIIEVKHDEGTNQLTIYCGVTADDMREMGQFQGNIWGMWSMYDDEAKIGSPTGGLLDGTTKH